MSAGRRDRIMPAPVQVRVRHLALGASAGFSEEPDPAGLPGLQEGRRVNVWLGLLIAVLGIGAGWVGCAVFGTAFGCGHRSEPDPPPLLPLGQRDLVVFDFRRPPGGAT